MALVVLAAVSGSGLVAWALVGQRGRMPAGSAWRGLWPQDSREEAQQAQLAAIRGDARYSWQLDFDGEEVFVRYAREVLGWSQPQPISIHIPEGQDWAREAQVLQCAPGPHPDYPEIDCAPPKDRTYPAVNITVERLIRRNPGGIWIVTGVERTKVHLPAPASKDEVRRFVTAFLERRVRGLGAERYLSREGRSRFGVRFGRLGPLYRSIAGFRYGRSEITFVDGPLWPYGGFEVGVRLLPESGPGVHDETLFVGPGTDPSGGERPLLILGGRRGLSGP